MDKKEYNTLNVIVTIVQWWKVLLIVGVASVLVSGGLSLLITPRYQSQAVIMTTSSNALSQMVLSSNNYSPYLDATQFGTETEIDQALQILNSRQLKDYLINKFNLINHYGIDTNGKYWKTSLYGAITSSVEFSRTRYLGVGITVIDESPQMAADIANEIVDYYDTLKRKIIRERLAQAESIALSQIDDLNQVIKQTQDSLSVIMQHGVYDHEMQTERLMQQYAKDVAAGNFAAVERIKKEMLVLAQYGAAYMTLKERLKGLESILEHRRMQYQAMTVDADYIMSQKFVVDKAMAADKKAYPKRMMIVLVSLISTLALAMMLIICKEGIKNFYRQVKEKK